MSILQMVKFTLTNLMKWEKIKEYVKKADSFGIHDIVKNTYRDIPVELIIEVDGVNIMGYFAEYEITMSVTLLEHLMDAFNEFSEPDKNYFLPIYNMFQSWYKMINY